MPFSWKKKSRCNRFSQLVADHLQSPKRGGSLVVETGFPTSLIDLYVRNRSRFRKSSAKKSRENDSPTLSSSQSSSGLLVDSSNSSFGAIDYSQSNEIIEEDVIVGESKIGINSNNSSFSARHHKQIDEIIEEDIVVVEPKIRIEESSKTEVEASVEISKSNPVMVFALKVLLMVVLALGTKRFTLGITVSAFVLFFVELVGKPLLMRSSLIRPRVDSKPLVESSFHETTNITISKEIEEEEEVESKQDVRSEKELHEVRGEVSMEIRHKSSRKAIMKSRMKKLVPKKLRRSSMGSKGEISSEGSDSTGATVRISKEKEDKVIEIESSSTLSSEIDSDKKELVIESRQKSGDLVLCLMVLIGLIGGRIMALVLALSWCLMLKKLQKWRNVKFPIS